MNFALCTLAFAIVLIRSSRVVEEIDPVDELRVYPTDLYPPTPELYPPTPPLTPLPDVRMSLPRAYLTSRVTIPTLPL